ncbi:MFS transporter, partial [Lactobacillus sp. 23-2]|uniref:MFS transporter n=1 Tax=Lactobacillus sp. 23-2 TaxID=2981842 RepID=UPI003832DD0A
MLGCNEYMIVGVLPDISREIGAPLSRLGYLVTVFALVYAISTPLVTSLTRYLKRHQLLYLLLSRILSATTAGAIISLVLVIANFVAPMDKRASLLSWVFAGFSIASIIGLPIGTLISTTWSWHASFWMISLLTVIVLVLVFLYVPKDTPQALSKQGQKQFAILKDRGIRFAIYFVVMTCAAQYTYYSCKKCVQMCILVWTNGIT